MQTWTSFGGNWITSEACLLGQTPYPCTANSICDGPTHTRTLKASMVFLQQDECLFNKGAFYHTKHTNRLMNHTTANWQFDICTNGLLGCSNGVTVKPREILSRNGSDLGWWVAFSLSKWNECCVVFLVISLSNHESQEFGYSSVGESVGAQLSLSEDYFREYEWYVMHSRMSVLWLMKWVCCCLKVVLDSWRREGRCCFVDCFLWRVILCILDRWVHWFERGSNFIAFSACSSIILL